MKNLKTPSEVDTKKELHEVPDRWLIVRFTDTYKIFATWRSSYGSGESWRVNSGITKVESDKEEYRFFGYSGSCYHCRKDSYGTTNYGYQVLDDVCEKLKTAEFDKPVVLEDQDWKKFFYK